MPDGATENKFLSEFKYISLCSLKKKKKKKVHAMLIDLADQREVNLKHIFEQVTKSVVRKTLILRYFASCFFRKTRFNTEFITPSVFERMCCSLKCN